MVCQSESMVVGQLRSTLLVSSYMNVYGEATQLKDRGKESVKRWFQAGETTLNVLLVILLLETLNSKNNKQLG